MEFYHNQLKLRLLNEDPGVYQCADWLVDKLGTKVHSYFWLDEYSEKDDFARYRKDEWVSGLTSWHKSLKIPDLDVVMEGKYAKVIDQEDRDRVHVVWNPGSEFAICDCSWAEMGNLCEHVFKIIKFCRDKGSTLPSISMFQYNQALVNMLHCPAHDSLIRDHSVSLAIWVQMQLNAQVDLESSHTTVDPTEQQTVGPVRANQDRDVVNENHCANENTSHTKNGSAVGHEASGSITSDLGSDLIDQVAGENNICGERDGVDISCTEMEVDPSSICTTASRLFCVDWVVSADVFTENGERILIDAGPDITKNLPSTDDLFSNLNSIEDDILDKDSCENVMGVEPQSNDDIPLSTTASQEQCTTIHQNGVCSNDVEPLAIPYMKSVDPKINNASPSVSIPIVEASGVIKENGQMELQNENGSTIQNLSSMDDVVPLEGVQDNMAED